MFLACPLQHPMWRIAESDLLNDTPQNEEG
jgi:hypothetical protein